MDEKLKQLIQAGKFLLEKDNVQDFYRFLEGSGLPDELKRLRPPISFRSPEWTKEITQMFKDSGINVVEYLRDTIPTYCFYDSNVHDYLDVLISVGTFPFIQLPSHIKNIDWGGFTGCNGLKAIDLRGKTIYNYAFEDTDLREILIDGNTIFDEAECLDETPLENIYIEAASDEDYEDIAADFSANLHIAQYEELKYWRV